MIDGGTSSNRPGLVIPKVEARQPLEEGEEAASVDNERDAVKTCGLSRPLRFTGEQCELGGPAVARDHQRALRVVRPGTALLKDLEAERPLVP